MVLDLSSSDLAQCEELCRANARCIAVSREIANGRCFGWDACVAFQQPPSKPQTESISYDPNLGISSGCTIGTVHARKYDANEANRIPPGTTPPGFPFDYSLYGNKDNHWGHHEDSDVSLINAVKNSCLAGCCANPDCVSFWVYKNDCRPYKSTGALTYDGRSGAYDGGAISTYEIIRPTPAPTPAPTLSPTPGPTAMPTPTPTPEPNPCGLPPTVDPNNVCELFTAAGKTYGSIDVDTVFEGTNPHVTLTIAKAARYQDHVRRWHPSSDDGLVGTLTDETLAHGRYVLSCKQGTFVATAQDGKDNDGNDLEGQTLGFKTLKLTVKRPTDWRADGTSTGAPQYNYMGAEFVNMYKKGDWTPLRCEFEPFTFNDYGSKVPLKDARTGDQARQENAH